MQSTAATERGEKAEKRLEQLGDEVPTLQDEAEKRLLAHGSDVEAVRALLLEIARAQPEVLEDPAPRVIFMQHGQRSLDFELLLFIPSPLVRLTLRDRINKAINREFAQRGIEMPFPQRDLHLKSSSLEPDGLLRPRRQCEARDLSASESSDRSV